MLAHYLPLLAISCSAPDKGQIREGWCPLLPEGHRRLMGQWCWDQSLDTFPLYLVCPPPSPPPLPGLASWWCPPVPQAEHSGGLGPCLSQVSLLSLPPCSVAPQGHHNHLHKASSLGSPLPTLLLPNFQRLPDFCLNKVPSQGGPAPTRPSVCSSALPACPPATHLTLSCSLLSSAWVPPPPPRRTQVPRPLPET